MNHPRDGMLLQIFVGERDRAGHLPLCEGHRA